MRIALIGSRDCQQFPTISYGGIEACVENLAWGLHRAHKDFVCIIPRRKVAREYPFEIVESEIPPLPGPEENVWPFAKSLPEIIKRVKPDIIWSQSFWSAETLKPLGIPIICTFHDFVPDHRRKFDWFSFRENTWYRFVSLFQLRQWVDPTSDWQHERSFFLHTGIREEEYSFCSPKDREGYYLWVAGLNWGWQNKGLDIFVELARRQPERSFIAYGTGKPDLEKKLLQLNKIIKNFEYRGELKRGVAHREAFSKARLFLMPTKIPEPFGRTVLESISKGTPVIGSCNGALPELITNGVNGFIANSIGEFESHLNYEFDYETCFQSAKRFHIDVEVEALVSRSMQILGMDCDGTLSKTPTRKWSPPKKTFNPSTMQIFYQNERKHNLQSRPHTMDNNILKIIYRICDQRNGCTKIPQFTKRQCFLNFLEVFDCENMIVVADNTSDATIDFLGLFTKNIERTSLGNAASFIYALNIAIEFDDDHSVYLVEDDYLHQFEGPQFIAEGLERADYVSLYDHADKYMTKSLNPLVSSGGENTKVILTHSTHWKYTSSTTMTFAAKAKTLKADQEVFRRFCNEEIPFDYSIFRRLAESGRTVITPIPGRSTHCDEHPSPFFFGSPLPFKQVEA